MSRAGGPRWRRAALLAAAALVAGACAGGRAKPLDTEVLPPAFTYVAVGASETVGAGADDPATGSWPNVFYRTALARSATLVNVGMPGATVSQALDRELQPALAEQPRLVTVWLNVDDLGRQVPVEQYERDLGTLVHALRRGGATDVLVASTPPVVDLPAVRACLPGGTGCRLPGGLPGADVIAARVAAYDAAITRVAKAEGAVVVDLVAATAGGDRAVLVGPDGLHLSTEGHRRVAAAFAAALAAMPSTGPLRPPPTRPPG